MHQGSAGEEIFLRRGRSQRIGASVAGLALVVAMCGWIAFCLFNPSQPGQSSGTEARSFRGRHHRLTRAVVGVNIIRRGWLRNRLGVATDTLTIDVGQTLRRPLKLDRADIAAILVDDAAVANGDERLRFSVGDAYLYSSVAGSALAMLGGEGTVPNVALVFKRPLSFDEPRRLPPANGRAPLEPLRRSLAVPGILLCCEHPHALPATHDLQAVPSAGHPEPLTALRPLTEGQTARSLAVRSVALALAVTIAFLAQLPGERVQPPSCQSRRPPQFCSGLLLDARLRARERGGWARLVPLLLLATGLVALSALATASRY